MMKKATAVFLLFIAATVTAGPAAFSQTAAKKVTVTLVRWPYT
jgi:hypothetical protein